MSARLVLTASTPPPMINEDEPGWNCATMGNLICGPSTPDPVLTVSSTPDPTVYLVGIGVVYVLAALVLGVGMALSRRVRFTDAEVLIGSALWPVLVVGGLIVALAHAARHSRSARRTRMGSEVGRYGPLRW